MFQSKKRVFTLFAIAFLLSYIFMCLPKDAFAATSTGRLAGLDRYETAVAISEYGWKQSGYAILATGENFPDALCAAPLAKKFDAPILLTGKDSLDREVSGELKRLNAKQVFIIGGKGVISENVENDIKALGINYIRISGSDRYDTSVEVAKYLGTSSEVIIATGDDFPDALSIAPVAASKNIPIILSSKSNIPSKVQQFLDSKNYSKAYVIGGTGVIGDSVYRSLPSPERLWGSDRYQTNLAVINKFSDTFNFSTTYVATGQDFPDALSGSALAPKTSSPIVLVDKVPNKIVKDFFTKKLPSVSQIQVLGGEGVVPPRVITDILYSYNSTTAYTLLNSGKYEYTIALTIENNSRWSVQDVSAEVDLGRLNDSPYQNDESITVSGPGVSIVEDSYGNKKAVINLPSMSAGQTAEYKFIRNFTSGGIRYNTDLSKTSGDYGLFSDYKKYTSPEERIQSDNSIIQKKASEIVKGETNPYYKARKIFEFINTTIAYDFSEANKGALNALETQKGVCEDFADLFAAMARSQGIPARVVYGYWLEDMNFTGSEDLSTYGHAWVEFYLPEYGWIVAEPTVIKTNYRGTREPAFDYFGNLNEPGHFIRGYENVPFYSVKYFTTEGVHPDISASSKVYITKK